LNEILAPDFCCVHRSARVPPKEFSSCPREVGAAHGGQQLALWNAHHDERGFASMHIYHVATGTPVVTILRPARTPKGTVRSQTRTSLCRHSNRSLFREREFRREKMLWGGGEEIYIHRR
jgi:hypothetical protein